MNQKSFSTLGGLLGIITVLSLVAVAFVDDPEAEWSSGSSPLVPAFWVAILALLVLLLSRTPLRSILPLKILGMWTFGVFLGGAAAAVILTVRGEWNMAWQMLVLGLSGFLAQFLVGIPYRAEQDRAIREAIGYGPDSESPIQDFTRNPSMELEEFMAVTGRQQMRSEQFLESVAASWPDRNTYGWPFLTADVMIWQEARPRWERATLEASLSPGVLTATPNFAFGVTYRSDAPGIRSGSVYLLERPDLSRGLPAYELRWIDRATQDPHRAALASDSANVAILAEYLKGYWGEDRSSATLERLLAPEATVFPPEPPP